MYNGDKKENELMNCKFVDKSNGGPKTYKIWQCTSTIQDWKSINGYALQIFMQILLDNHSSVSNLLDETDPIWL